MHPRLVSWARAVKARQRGARRQGKLPVVWLFTDAGRMPDVVAAVRRLPAGCGVVFRHDGVADRLALARRVAGVCRARRLVMVMTAPALPGVGLHVRRGRFVGRRPRLLTSSAHSRLEVLRARRAGAAAVFLSPLFATASHPGGRALGGLGWRLAAWGVSGVWALGGVDWRTIGRVPAQAAGFGAIGALAECGVTATVFRDCHDTGVVAVADNAPARQ